MKQKILHITTSHRGGAGIAAHRLHNALQDMGIASAYLSKGLSTDFENEIYRDSFFNYNRPGFLKKLKNKFFPSKAIKNLRKFEKVKTKTNCEVLSFPLTNIALHNHPMVKAADIIHLHWVGDLINFPTFFSEIKKPIVWTLHDMNPFMGIFHYKEDALINKHISELDKDMLKIKSEALKYVENGALISPSSWLLEEAEKSQVFNHFKVKKVIANGINLENFRVIEQKESRKNFNISEKENVLLFIAASLEVHRKGFDLLKEALENIQLKITLLTVGKGLVEIKNKNITVLPLGYIDKPKKLNLAYSSADALILPSREENLPNTMLEAFASGTPTISSEVGGMKEHLSKKTNGILIEEVSAKALAEAIVEFFETSKQEKSNEIRHYAEHHFFIEKQALKYQEVYKNIVKTT